MKIGDIVYFKTDTSQQPHMVTGYQVRVNYKTWILSCNGLEVYAFDFEISENKSYI